MTRVHDHGRPAERTAVLIHGLGASGRYFGGLYEDLGCDTRVVIPDLLGFGDGRDERRVDFSLEAHLDALDEVIGATTSADEPLVLAAHSMGTALAFGLARRHGKRVQRIVAWGPPIYPSPRAAANDSSSHGGMTRLLLSGSPWSERLCRLNCANPTAMGWGMAALAPSMPTPVVRDASRHTWNSFRASLDGLVLDVDWASLLDVDVPIRLVRGTDDSIGDVGYVRTLVDSSDRVEMIEVDGAGHHVAITHADLGRSLLCV